MHTRLRGNAGEQRATGTRHSFHPLRSVGMKLFLVFFVTIALLVGSVGLFSFFRHEILFKVKSPKHRNRR